MCKRTVLERVGAFTYLMSANCICTVNYSANAAMIQHSEGPQNAPKYAFRDPKNWKIFWRGGRPLPQWGGDTPYPYLTPFGACGASIRAPLALDLPPCAPL